MSKQPAREVRNDCGSRLRVRVTGSDPVYVCLQRGTTPCCPAWRRSPCRFGMKEAVVALLPQPHSRSPPSTAVMGLVRAVAARVSEGPGAARVVAVGTPEDQDDPEDGAQPDWLQSPAGRDGPAEVWNHRTAVHGQPSELAG
jgi:hypothetical protein